MNIPMVNLKRQVEHYRNEFKEAIWKVIDNTAFIGGQTVSDFENAFAKYCGAKHAIGVGNGTDAIAIVLEAMGIGVGDEVITTPYTFAATVESIMAVGATVKFVDIQSQDFLMNPDQLEDAITKHTKAIIPVHLYGQLCNMSAINDIAKKHGLKVIEDAAQAHGARNADGIAGSLADAATFSFYPGKNMGAFGDAGGVVTNDDKVAARVFLIRNHGQPKKYTYEIPGRNSRLDCIHAAVLTVKLKYIDEWNSRRVALASAYQAGLNKLEANIKLPNLPGDQSHVFHLYTIRTKNRDELFEHMKDKGIGCAVHYPKPLHLQPAYANLGYKAGDLPVAEAAAGEVISLPLCSDLSDDELATVVGEVEAFYQA